MTDDPIDEWVTASLENGGKVAGYIGLCPNKCGSMWHGVASYSCPGSHVQSLSDEQLQAIESQGLHDYDAYADYIFRGEN